MYLLVDASASMRMGGKFDQARRIAAARPLRSVDDLLRVHGIGPVRLAAMRTLGVPYTEAEVKASADEVKGKTELDALVAYLQVLGTANK